jgi:hypothetical protein
MDLAGDEAEAAGNIDDRGALRRRAERNPIEPRFFTRGELAGTLADIVSDTARRPAKLVGELSLTAWICLAISAASSTNLRAA